MLETGATAEAATTKKPDPVVSVTPETSIPDEAAISLGFPDEETATVESPEKLSSDKPSSDSGEHGGEFKKMIRFMMVIVTFIIEAMLDSTLAILMLLPLLLPWRVYKIFKTNVFNTSVFSDRVARIAARKAAFAHACGAISDLIVLPMAILACASPMRAWAVIDALINQTEYRSDLKGWYVLKQIDYDFSLRIALFANFWNMLLDLPCAICGLIALIFPWRTWEVIRGSCRIGSHIPHRVGYKHTMKFQLPELGWRKERPKHQGTWKNLKSFVAMRKRQAAAKKEDEQTEEKKPGYFSRMSAEPWSGRMSGSLHHVRVWWFMCFMSTLMDLLAMILTILAMLIPTRWEPFTREVYHTLLGAAWPRYTFKIQGEEKHFKIAPWKGLHLLCYYNALYALIDLGAVICGTFAFVTMLRSMPLINNLKLDWRNSPRFVNVSLPAGVDLGPDFSVWDINGRYVRRGWFRDHPCFRRRSGESDKRSRGLLGYWDGWWQVCPMEVTDSALARFGADEDTIARHSPISESRPGRWEVRRGKDGPWEATECSLTVTSSDSAHTMWFGRNGYNSRIRMHCFKQAFFFILDCLLLPLVLFTFLTGYRAKSIFIKMKEDGMPDDDELDGEEMVGYRLAFGWKCRKECLRQPLLFVLDVIILPLFLCVCLTFWRLPEVFASFDYFDLGFHKEVLSKTHIICFDIFLVIPALLLLATQYRMKYVWEVYAQRPVGKVDWGTRMEALRQCGLLLCDLLTAIPAATVLGTYYRRPELSTFEPRNLSWHKSVWLQFLVVLHDLTFGLGFALFLIFTIRRLKPICRSIFEVYNSIKHGDALTEITEKGDELRILVYIQFWLFILDLAASPCIFIVGITWYRIRYVGSLFRLDEEFHEDVFQESVIVLFDIIMYGPMLIVLLLTLYRVRPVVREMRRDSCGCICCSVRDYARETARRNARRRRRRQRLKALSGRGATPTDDDEDEPEQQRDMAPRAWHNLNRQLTEADDGWAERIDWNQAPMFDPEPQVRLLIKQNFKGLLWDIPIMFVGIPLLIFMWRLPVVCREWPNRPLSRDRRRLIAWQSLLTMRDLFVFPFFLVLLVTQRGLPLLRQLCARRQSRRLNTRPKLHIDQVELVFPEAQQGKGFLRFHTRMDPSCVGVIRGSLRLHVSGPGFWTELTKAIGRFKTGAMRSVLPIQLRPRNSDVYEVLGNALDFSAVLTDQSIPERPEAGNAIRTSAMSQVSVFGDVRNMDQALELNRNVEFIVWLPGTYTHRAQQKALQVLEKMDGLEFMLLQVEGKDLVSRQPIVLCRAAMRVFTITNLVRSKGGTVQGEAFADDETVRWCQDAHTPGLIESFGALVGWELGQFCLDQAHFLLTIILILAPWRWIHLLKYLCEPSDYWPSHVGDELCEIQREAELVLRRRVRYEMRSVCNSLARNLQQSSVWCGPEGMINVPGELHAYRSEATYEHRKLLGMMRSRLYSVAPPVAEAAKTWLEIQDARFYYAVLGCYLQCLVSAERISLEEHDIMMDTVKKADRQFGAVEERASQTLKEVHREAWKDARSKQWESLREGKVLKSCCCCKEVAFIRQIIRAVALAAFYDYASIIAFVFILLSMYRIPLVVRTFINEPGMRLTSVKFKTFCLNQIFRLLRDLGYGIMIFFFTLGILLTLVRIPEAFEDVVTKQHTVETLAFVLRWNFYDALSTIFQNFLLLGMLRTWKLIVSAAIQSLLLPPVCLGELLNRTLKVVRMEIRCAIATVVFYGVILTPPITRWVDPPSPAPSVMQGVLAAVLFLCFCSVATAMRLTIFYTLPKQEWKSSTMRPTWCNMIACSSSVLQPSLLCMLLCGLYGESWPLTISCGAAQDLMPLGIVLTCFWLVLISMLLLVSLHEATPLWVLQITISQLFFMPIVFMFLGPTFGNCSRDDPDAGVTESECVAFAFFFAYIVTTQLFSMDSPMVKSLPRACGMGVRYAPLYIMCAQLFDLLIAILPIFFEGSGKAGPLIVVFLVAIARALWTSFYKRFFGHEPCCIPHVSVVRIGSSVLIAWTALVLLLDFLPGVIWWVGVVLLVVGTSAAVWQTRKKAMEVRNQELKLSGITNIVTQLLTFEQNLLDRGALVVGWVESGHHDRWRLALERAETARLVAHHLLDLEECIQAEQMSSVFLDRREIWRDEMFGVRNISTLKSLLKELQDTMRTPSTVPALMKVCSQILGRQDLAPFVLDSLVGHQHLVVLMQAAVLALPSWTVSPSNGVGYVDMMAHCRQAWAIMEDVLLHFARESLEVTAYERKFLLLSPWQGDQKWSSKVLHRMNTRNEDEHAGLNYRRFQNTSEWDDRSGTRIYGPDGAVHTTEPLHITRAGREGGLLDPNANRADIRVPDVTQVVDIIEGRQQNRRWEIRHTEHEFTAEGRVVDRRSAFLLQPTGVSERDLETRRLSARLSVQSTDSPDVSDEADANAEPAAASNSNLTQTQRMQRAAQRGRQEMQSAEDSDIPQEAMPNSGPAFQTHEARAKHTPGSRMQTGMQHPVVEELTQEADTAVVHDDTAIVNDEASLPSNCLWTSPSRQCSGEGACNEGKTNSGTSGEVHVKVEEEWRPEETIVGKSLAFI